MSTSSGNGVLHICIQGGLGENQSSLMAHRQLHDNYVRLIEELKDLRLPATWAVSHRHLELFKTAAAQDRNRTELALLTDLSWCSPTISRKSFLAELRGQLDLFRSLDDELSTLVLHCNSVERHINALSREGIKIVRRQAIDTNSRKLRPNTAPRYGMMVIEPSAVLPGRPEFWARWDCAYSAKRCLWKAMSLKQPQHVAIDLGQLIQLPESRMRQLDGWLRTVARLKDAGRLEVELLHNTLRRNCPSRRDTASQSILRAA